MHLSMRQEGRACMAPSLPVWKHQPLCNQDQPNRKRVLDHFPATPCSATILSFPQPEIDGSISRFPLRLHVRDMLDSASLQAACMKHWPTGEERRSLPRIDFGAELVQSCPYDLSFAIGLFLSSCYVVEAYNISIGQVRRAERLSSVFSRHFEVRSSSWWPSMAGS